MTLSPLHFVVNWPVFTILSIYNVYHVVLFGSCISDCIVCFWQISHPARSFKYSTNFRFDFLCHCYTFLSIMCKYCIHVFCAAFCYYRIERACIAMTLAGRGRFFHYNFPQIWTDLDKTRNISEERQWDITEKKELCYRRDLSDALYQMKCCSTVIRYE